MTAAHKALHRVGAGQPRVGCTTPDPEAKAILANLIAARARELPCGHTVADLIGGTDPDGRPSVTTCGACLETRQPEIRAKNQARLVLISGLRALIDRWLVPAPFVPDLEERCAAVFGDDFRRPNQPG